MDWDVSKSTFVNCIKTKYKLLEVSVLNEDTEEASLSPCLLSQVRKVSTVSTLLSQSNLNVLPGRSGKGDIK